MTPCARAGPASSAAQPCHPTARREEHYDRGVIRKSKPSKASSDQEQVRIGYKMMGLGWQFVTEMLAGAFLGWVIGRWLGDDTLGTMIGLGVGFIVATYSLIRGALKLNSALDAIERRSGKVPPKPLMNPRNGEREANSHDR